MADPPEPASESTPLPARGCLLGLDYGSKRVGVAVCDSGQSIASPLQVLRQGAGVNYDLRQIAEEYQAVGLVVGLPVHMSGDEGEKASLARQFGDAVATALKLPVVYHDERFTSKMADSAMMDAGLSRDKRKARVDMIAAQMILQGFLDSGKQERLPGSIST